MDRKNLTDFHMNSLCILKIVIHGHIEALSLDVYLLLSQSTTYLHAGITVQLLKAQPNPKVTPCAYEARERESEHYLFSTTLISCRFIKNHCQKFVIDYSFKVEKKVKCFQKPLLIDPCGFDF